MKLAAMLCLLFAVTAPLSAQGPASGALKQQNTITTQPAPAINAIRLTGQAHTKQGAVLGSMAGLMAGIVMATVAGPIGDSADTPGGAVKVVALSIAAGVALGALIGSLIH